MGRPKYWDGSEWVEVAPSAKEFDTTNGYGVATGTNALVVNLSPALPALVAGATLRFKNTTANTGAVSLNVNGLGAKAVLKSGNSHISAGGLKAGGVYTVCYDGTNFILQGEGGEYGNATAARVLQGYTFGTENGIVSGTMPNRGAMTFTPSASQQTIPAGYHNGGGRVNPGSLRASGNGQLTNGVLTISGLDFQPKEILVWFGAGSQYSERLSYIDSPTDLSGINRTLLWRNAGNNSEGAVLISQSWTVLYGIAYISLESHYGSSGSQTFKWVATA